MYTHGTLSDLTSQTPSETLEGRPTKPQQPASEKGISSRH
jgi:hypothetical protein